MNCYDIIYVNCIEKEEKIEIYPNPFDNYFIVSFKNWYIGETFIKLFNISGTQVKKLKLNIENKNSEHKIYNKNIKSDIYLLKIYSNDFIQTFKISKL